MSELEWQNIQRESISVLEQVMRASIRDSQVSEAQSRIPSLISYTFSEENALTIQALTLPFVVPNSLFSKESTDKAIQDAIEKVEPVEKAFATGEIIIRRGQILDATAYEALTKMDLISPKDQGQASNMQQLFSQQHYYLLLASSFPSVEFPTIQLNNY